MRPRDVAGVRLCHGSGLPLMERLIVGGIARKR
jgi:hypothetical protein